MNNGRRTSSSVQSPDFYQLAFAPDDDLFGDDNCQGDQSTNTSSISLMSQERITEQCEDLSKINLSKKNSFSHQLTSHTGFVKILDINEFVNRLVYGLKSAAITVIEPNLPAHIIFGALRLYDKENDEVGFTECFSQIHDAIKEMLSEESSFEIVLFWLTSSLKLLNLLRQYSTEDENVKEEWFEKNTDVQKIQRLQKVDGESFRRQLEARIESGYQCLLKKHVEPVLIPKIVPAILMHDATKSNSFEDKGLASLLNYMTSIISSLKSMSADEDLIKQIFCQLTQWLSSLALNQMMFRKDLCTFEKAVVIKHNVVELEDWLKTNKFGEFCVFLNPLIQACHLLQSQKTPNNIETLSGEMTDDLKPKQIISILKHYTPSIDFEEEEPSEDFLEALETELNKREDGNKELVMAGTYVIPLDLSKFIYSNVNLETISLPGCLRLGKACRLI